MTTEAQKNAQKAYRKREKEAGRFKRVTIEFTGADGAEQYARLREASEAKGVPPASFVRALIVKALG